MAKKIYVVKKGKKIGIFSTWEECKTYVHGYPGAQYKSFAKEEEAKAYLTGGQADISSVDESLETCTAYVDGSFDQTQQGYSYGCILIYKGKKIELSQAFFNTEDVSMRNVAGELEGAMAAMAYCEKEGIPRLHLYYDYQGIEAWATGKWRRNKAGTIRYKKFYDSLKTVTVMFHKVKGHSGVALNEEVDRLAKKALGIL